MTPERRILLIGAGGHAKVVIDIIETAAAGTIVGILDDDPARHGAGLCGYPVLGGRDALPALLAARSNQGPGPLFGIITIGHNRIRRDLAEWFVAAGGCLLPAAIHPKACVAGSVRLGAGSVVMAGAVVNADACIGENAIINTGALVDHDCIIGNDVHLGPATALCGGVCVGEGSLLGVGSRVVPSVKIGRWVTLGAGAVVIAAIADGVVATGVPATVRS